MILKKLLKKVAPSLFYYLRNVKDQVVIEIRTLRAIGIYQLGYSYLRASKIENELPVQSVEKYQIPGLVFDDVKVFCEDFVISAEGSHTIYLSPEDWRHSPFAPLAIGYPSNAGLKLVKRAGSADGSYVSKESGGKIQRLVLGSHNQHLLVMAFLFLNRIGPRLYDLLEIDAESAVVTAYVVEHVSGSEPSIAQCESAVAKLRKMVETGALNLINWNGFDDHDFQCPGCNGNLIQLPDGQAIYVDTQNFVVPEYGAFLESVARQASAASHFGDKSFLLGGTYLYQKVPGCSLPAKRNPEDRMAVLDALLVQSGVELRGAKVIDVGCNMGLMGAQYLKRGASWYHGFDLPEVVEHTQRVLLAIGCTRFTLTGVNLAPEVKLNESLPIWIGERSGPIVLSYLAIRGHVGWLTSLADLAWDYMIYEGHEGESFSDTSLFFEALRGILDFDVISRATIEDGASLERQVAILQRIKS